MASRRRRGDCCSGGPGAVVALALLALLALLQPHSAWPTAATALSVSSAHSPSVHVERMLLQRALPRAPHSDDPRRPVATAEEAEQFESRSFSVAVFSVSVDDAAELYATDTASGELSDLSSFPVHGLTRLVCNGAHMMVFESYHAPNRHRHSFHATAPTVAAEKARLLREARARAGASTEEDKRAAAGMAGPDDDDEVATDVPTMALQSGPPVFLVPLHGAEMARALNRSGSAAALHDDDDDEDELHPIYRLLALNRAERVANLAAHGSGSVSPRLEFALLSSYRYGGVTNAPKHIYPPRELRKCTLKFLKPVQQIYELRGVERAPGAYVLAEHKLLGAGAATAAGAAWTPLTGDVTFERRRAQPTRQEHERFSPSLLRESWDILRPFVFDAAATDAWPQVAAPGDDDDDGGVAALLNSPECQFDTDGTTVFLESDAATYGTVASQTRGMMAGLITPVVSAVVGTFESVVGGFILNGAQEFLPGGVADSIVEQVTRQLPPMIARKIIPAIGESVSATLPPATTEKITPYASHGISYKVSHDIVEDLTKNLVINIHRLVDVEMPKTLAILHGHIVPHLLDRSVTHSTVAALTHTLAHSPLHDSFCMMCYQFQKQCEFCHFNQQKIMYGLYYSHYFSTYYSDYYSEYFTQLMAVDRIRALQPAQQHAQDRLRYRRIYSDKGEQVTRLWRRGEPGNT